MLAALSASFSRTSSQPSAEQKKESHPTTLLGANILKNNYNHDTLLSSSQIVFNQIQTKAGDNPAYVSLMKKIEIKKTNLFRKDLEPGREELTQKTFEKLTTEMYGMLLQGKSIEEKLDFLAENIKTRKDELEGINTALDTATLSEKEELERKRMVITCLFNAFKDTNLAVEDEVNTFVTRSPSFITANFARYEEMLRKNSINALANLQFEHRNQIVEARAKFIPEGKEIAEKIYKAMEILQKFQKKKQNVEVKGFMCYNYVRTEKESKFKETVSDAQKTFVDLYNQAFNYKTKVQEFTPTFKLIERNATFPSDLAFKYGVQEKLNIAAFNGARIEDELMKADLLKEIDTIWTDIYEKFLKFQTKLTQSEEAIKTKKPDSQMYFSSETDIVLGLSSLGSSYLNRNYSLSSDLSFVETKTETPYEYLTLAEAPKETASEASKETEVPSPTEPIAPVKTEGQNDVAVASQLAGSKALDETETQEPADVQTGVDKTKY